MRSGRSTGVFIVEADRRRITGYRIHRSRGEFLVRVRRDGRNGTTKVLRLTPGNIRWGRSNKGVVDGLLTALPAATEAEERDSIIGALGALKSKTAVPALAALIREPSTDGDTRRTAVEALGHIVRRRFDRRPDPEAAALAWLERHHPQAAP